MIMLGFLRVLFLLHGGIPYFLRNDFSPNSNLPSSGRWSYQTSSFLLMTVRLSASSNNPNQQNNIKKSDSTLDLMMADLAPAKRRRKEIEDLLEKKLWRTEIHKRLINCIRRSCHCDNRTSVSSRSTFGVYYDQSFEDVRAVVSNNSILPKDCNEILKNGNLLMLTIFVIKSYPSGITFWDSCGHEKFFIPFDYLKCNDIKYSLDITNLVVL